MFLRKGKERTRIARLIDALHSLKGRQYLK
ncbi:hypothetical protein [Candidatus Nanopusillus massiliensis]|nr:hypothetical protein [Candidatus Nanopusillus massiliensis]